MFKSWRVLQVGVIYKVYNWIAQQIPKIRWTNKNPRTEEEKQKLATLLASGYFVILTGNSSHLSSTIVKIMSWFKLGKWPKYSHALMNCDFISDPTKRDGFKFMEATAVGVHHVTFDEVFDCDTYCLLEPINVTRDEFEGVIDALVKENGKPYDDLFDLADQNKISCVELVRVALQADPGYKDDFAHFEIMIENEKNLLPEMYRDCPDFKVVCERSINK